MVVQVDGGDAGGQDVYHPDRHDAPVQPVLLVEGAVAHLRPVRREFSLRKEKGGGRGGGPQNNKKNLVEGIFTSFQHTDSHSLRHAHLYDGG